jgi:hypothetical protein
VDGPDTNYTDDNTPHERTVHDVSPFENVFLISSIIPGRKTTKGARMIAVITIAFFIGGGSTTYKSMPPRQQHQR